MYELVLPQGMNLTTDEELYMVEGGNFLHVLGVAVCVAAVAIVVVPVILNPAAAVPALANGGWKAPAALFLVGVATFVTA